MAEPSWRLKLHRAEEHLFEINFLIEPFGQSHDYAVTETIEDDGQWTYRARTTVQANPYLAVVLGDFLFNIRSALDHLAVSLVPTNREYSASFPILTKDPEKIHPEDLKGDADRRDVWKKATTGMSANAVAIIRSKQPYCVEPPEIYRHLNLTPQDTVLAVLSAFQNADKHRRLITTVSGLNPQSVSVAEPDGEFCPVSFEPPAEGNMIEDGAVFFRRDSQMKVKAEGTAKVAARVAKNERGPYRKLPGFPIELLRLAGEIADLLEPCM